jgi:hypothetical protein
MAGHDLTQQALEEWIRLLLQCDWLFTRDVVDFESGLHPSASPVYSSAYSIRTGTTPVLYASLIRLPLFHFLMRRAYSSTYLPPFARDAGLYRTPLEVQNRAGR